ncbi:hypothetical protein V1508DRAFT_427240, partial [Lipomyces doorenjongii]|uniref:uncharacterized protein n=1 Tax=Lipomyces doorenjongii TaxID=383834 RepID=UPI0034CF0569
MMAGVNNSPDYVSIMKYGHFDPEGKITVTNSTRQRAVSSLSMGISGHWRRWTYCSQGINRECGKLRRSLL